jgi:hypothetical protein
MKFRGVMHVPKENERLYICDVRVRGDSQLPLLRMSVRKRDDSAGTQPKSTD